MSRKKGEDDDVETIFNLYAMSPYLIVLAQLEQDIVFVVIRPSDASTVEWTITACRPSSCNTMLPTAFGDYNCCSSRFCLEVESSIAGFAAGSGRFALTLLDRASDATTDPEKRDIDIVAI